MSDESVTEQPAKPAKRRGRPPKAKVEAPAASAPVEVKVVAPRNDPKALEPYAKPQWSKIKNQRPDREYQWFRRDQLDYKTRPHEIGNAHTGFLMVDGWDIEHDDSIQTGRQRDDAGSPVDTVVTNGELVLCSTPKSNFAKYQVIERKQDALIDQRFTGGQKIGFGGKTSFKTRTVGGRDGIEQSAHDILQGAA